MVQVIIELLDRLPAPVLSLVVFLLIFISGCILRKIILSRISQWAERTVNKVDDILIEYISSPLLFWSSILGVYVAVHFLSLSYNMLYIIKKFILITGIFSVTFVAANIISKIIHSYSAKIEAAVPVTGLTQNISRIIIFGLGILIIFNTLGISITPILATLGVGGLAIALALQDTLSNIFAGFYIIISKQIKIGDYVKLESGQEGHVTDITLRSTKIRMLPNNVVLIPNEKLIKTIVTNYYLPDKELAVLIDIGVHYDSDLTKVEKITCEVAKEIMNKVTGGVPGFDPFIRYHTFDDFSINFTVILRAKEFVDQYLIKHEFVKKLHERYKREGIIIPYPIRAINYSQEKALEK